MIKEQSKPGTNPHYVAHETIVQQSGISAEDLIDNFKKLEKTYIEGLNQTKLIELGKLVGSTGISEAINISMLFNPLTIVPGLIFTTLGGIGLSKDAYNTIRNYDQQINTLQNDFQSLYEQIKKQFK